MKKFLIPVLFVIGIVVAVAAMPTEIQLDRADRCEELGSGWSYWDSGTLGPRCENKDTGEHAPLPSAD